MEFLGIPVEDVAGLHVADGIFIQLALASGIVDGHAWLAVIDVDVEANPLAAVLHAQRLHLDASGYQVVPVIDRGDAVKHMVPRLLDVVRHHVLKGQHPIYIHIPGAGNQVFLVGVLPGELVADQMAAVVEVLPVHAVILHCLPACGLDRADGAPLLGGHQVRAYAGLGHAAASQPVQRAVGLIGLAGQLLLREPGHIVRQDHVRLPGEGRNSGNGCRFLALDLNCDAASCTCCTAQQHQQGQQGPFPSFHRR